MRGCRVGVKSLDISLGCHGARLAPDSALVVVLALPRLVAFRHPVPPVLGVIPGGIGAHAIHLVALVALLDFLMLEAVIPLAAGIAKLRGVAIPAHDPDATSRRTLRPGRHFEAHLSPSKCSFRFGIFAGGRLGPGIGLSPSSPLDVDLVR